ncbi:MAG: hypothetical protein WCC06_10850 [Candidatus Aminicenantales bacterium]
MKLKPMVLFLLLYVFSSSFLSASQRQGTFELFLGNYDIQESRFKAVYQKGGPIRGVIFSSTLLLGFDFYTEIKVFSKVGELTYTKEESRFYFVPISLGLRYILPSQYIRPYLGGGGDFCVYYETNVIGTIFNFTGGYHILGGVYFQFGEKIPILLNVRVKYTQVKARENNRILELGGVDYGGGVAIAF